ncbi:MAG: hypothetical protein JWN79_1658 [Gemmatimonadetes bacterium]|jgi:uncharacterized membrane protein|nr:hypothetical protein [Gemmatimonadota bacterium]
MDWAHIHIAINHFPVILAVMGTLSALLGLVTGKRGPWLYGATSLTLAGITVLPAYFTGGPAEHFLDRPWFVARGAIHAHERAALLSVVLVVIAGLASAVAWRRLVRYPREVVLPGWLRTIVLLSALAGTASIVYTSLLGGDVIHGAPVLQGPAPSGFTPVP